ncbi:MAG: sulfite exporter TauE/SafE family protein [Chloroflexi bacterium]|nr:sulfite exporter TauE/SafE family protein [Chloroflexota bacterium]
MNQLIVAFITGLTTGGLSCLAVQGGLLASSLEQQLEQQLDLQIEQEIAARRNLRSGKKRNRILAHPRLAVPILLFLIAKLAAYTVLGFLLGALGSMLQLNTVTRAILLIAVGIFMLGNALRMFNVHPIFRYFAIEPPKFITRYIRRKAKNGESFFAPLFLGALTVFIPCGVTQAMMAVAVGTGSALQGAVLMFAFILGTSPIFFIVAYLAMKLGTRMEKWFMRFVAVVLLVLGLVSINSGLTLMGSPFSVTNMIEAAKAAQPDLASAPVPQSDGVTLYVSAGNSGYSPRVLHARADTPITLNVVTNQTYSCSRSFVIPALGEEKLLPSSGTESISIPAQSAGTIMRFSCSMGMYTGEIVFDQ